MEETIESETIESENIESENIEIIPFNPFDEFINDIVVEEQNPLQWFKTGDICLTIDDFKEVIVKEIMIINNDYYYKINGDIYVDCWISQEKLMIKS